MTGEGKDDAGIESLSDIHAEAHLLLGRIDALTDCLQDIARTVFVFMLLRQALVQALRQEGYEFTDKRFFGWNDSRHHLSEQPTTGTLRPARVVREAVLDELKDSSWAIMAEAATVMRSACSSFSDHRTDNERDEVYAAVEEARAIVEVVVQYNANSPLSSLQSVHDLMSKSTRLARPEQSFGPLVGMDGRFIESHRPLCSPRWAMEIKIGELWRKLGIMQHALPWTGLIRLDSMSKEILEDKGGEMVRATALRDRAREMNQNLATSVTISERILSKSKHFRSTSRALHVASALAGFGPLQVRQLEVVASATRGGVLSMVKSLESVGLLRRNTYHGVVFYSYDGGRHSKSTAAIADNSFAFSRKTLDSYEQSLAKIDSLLCVTKDKNDD